MKNSKKVKQLVLAAFFVAIEVVLALTPLGFIPIGPIRATTMHIPVILAGILCGKKEGASLGFVFGLISLLMNTFNPTVTSFVFSPFISVGGMQGNFFSLLIVFGPRIFLGYFSNVMYTWLKKVWKNDIASIAVSAGVNTMIHTILVMGGIYIFFGEPYGAAKNMTLAGVRTFIGGVIAANGVMEMIVSAIIVPILVKVLKPAVARMGIYETKTSKSLNLNS